MRSRYSAYVLHLENYVLATWDPTTRPISLELDVKPAIQWSSLQILSAQEIGDMATVTFIASYRVGKRLGKMQEKSRFQRLEGRWLYIDGDVQD